MPTHTDFGSTTFVSQTSANATLFSAITHPVRTIEQAPSTGPCLNGINPKANGVVPDEAQRATAKEVNMLNPNLSMPMSLNRGAGLFNFTMWREPFRPLLEPSQAAAPARSLRALELLVQRAERQLAAAPDLREALAELPRLLINQLPLAYCRVSLVAADGQTLLPCAGQTTLPGWPGELSTAAPLPLELLPDGRRLERLPYSLVGAYREQKAREQLQRYSAALGMAEPLGRLLLLPLKRGGRLLAVLELGEMAMQLSEAEVAL
jgi:hypothetical protein